MTPIDLRQFQQLVKRRKEALHRTIILDIEEFDAIIRTLDTLQCQRAAQGGKR